MKTYILKLIIENKWFLIDVDKKYKTFFENVQELQLRILLFL